MELADSSAWGSRHKDASVNADFESRLLDGEIATCDQVKAELLYSTADADDFRETLLDLDALHLCPTTPAEWRRAFEVMHEFARQGPLRHRQVKFADLLIAAAAEQAGMAICHYDRDFERISAVTGQPVRAIAPVGSL